MSADLQTDPIVEDCNDHFRDLVHTELDKLLDSVDAVQGAFGLLSVEIPYQNGVFTHINRIDKRTRIK